MRLRVSLTVVAAVAALSLASVVAAEPAERIIRGGSIVTVNPAQPAAEAIAIRGGRIAAVGTEADVMPHRGPDTQVTDLAGRTLVPGFVDGHSHFFTCGEVQVQALCASPPAGTCRTVADVIGTLKQLQERRRLGPGRFVIGFGYDPELLAEKRAPTKQELDAAFPTTPCSSSTCRGMGPCSTARRSPSIASPPPPPRPSAA